MLRTFAEHTVRPTQSLDGLWSFLPECDKVPRGKLPTAFSRRIEVPSAWETIPDLRGYRGIGWFQRPIACSGQKHLRLRFGGVSHTATVWLDGKEIGQHYDAFTPWDLVVPAPKAGTHALTLKVDNRFTEESSLHIPNDYYTYGGITRPVELQEVPDLFVEKLFLTPLRAGKGWDLDVRVRLRNLGETALGGALRAKVAGTEGESELAPVPGGSRKEIHFRMSGLDVREWNDLDPALYPFHIELWQDGAVVDDLIDRVGFRTVEVRGTEFLYNGKPLRLRGFNRHEDHPMYGCAIPPAGMAHDLALIEDLNANFIRTCHYPNDMRFLDMCDERGFYVWEESHSRQTPFDNPNFMRQISDSNVEMVENHYNHPCIIM